jgi:hypothetical protein
MRPFTSHILPPLCSLRYQRRPLDFQVGASRWSSTRRRTDDTRRRRPSTSSATSVAVSRYHSLCCIIHHRKCFHLLHCYLHQLRCCCLPGRLRTVDGRRFRRFYPVNNVGWQRPVRRHSHDLVHVGISMGNRLNR